MASASSPAFAVFLVFGFILVVVCDASSNFGFDIHHVFSDPVRSMLAASGGFPERGTSEYYVALARRDWASRRRHLADAGFPTPLAFSGGNKTYRIDSLGYLYYANISVGTPGKLFLVALDTGSDLLWLPCDCFSCVHALKSAYTGDRVELSIYSPNNSSTSIKISCNSTRCASKHCSATRNTCPYEVAYVSNRTSSSGYLVEDVLHLVSEDKQSRVVDANITFGCGQNQTGTFLDGAAPNGLFGLGVSKISVPSILANSGLVANSFSMCFGSLGTGRITFGDQGSTDQRETPFILNQLHPTYNISITQIVVGRSVTDINFTAIFDSGTSFTYLNDPAYSQISESFNAQAQEKRVHPGEVVPFEYCYGLGAEQTSFTVPNVTLTMEGGMQYVVNEPIELISSRAQKIYCLGIVKSGDLNIIAQNFMTGYQIIFDREKNVLGWKDSDCDNIATTNATSTTSNLPISPQGPAAAPPSLPFEPEATSGIGNSTKNSRASSPPSANQWRSVSFFYCVLFMMIFLPFF